jgi:hypothetical protein
MSSTPSVVAAATTLAEWARERRRVWSDVPLDIPAPVLRGGPLSDDEPFVPIRPIPPTMAAIEEVEPDTILTEPMTFEPMVAEPIVPEPWAPEPMVPEPVMFAAADEAAAAGPSAFERAAVIARTGLNALAAAGRAAGWLFVAVVDRLERMREPAIRWLSRGAALVSTASVAGLILINRGELFTRLDHVSSMVVAAANRPQAAPAPVLTLPNGVGRLTITTGETEATVLIDGTASGTTPLTMNLPAGPHRILLRSPEGSVERAIRIQSGESSEINEAIYPGWVALTAAVDVTLSEGGKPLKRDDRGWAILPPGTHDIHLDNPVLGVHETRHVVVTPGGTTRLSFEAHSSTISLTTNEVADVWVDGQPYGQTPLVDQPISIGLHDVRLRSAAHERWLRIRATVQPVQVNVDLTADR